MHVPYTISALVFAFIFLPNDSNACTGSSNTVAISPSPPAPTNTVMENVQESRKNDSFSNFRLETMFDAWPLMEVSVVSMPNKAAPLVPLRSHLQPSTKVPLNVQQQQFTSFVKLIK